MSVWLLVLNIYNTIFGIIGGVTVGKWGWNKLYSKKKTENQDRRCVCCDWGIDQNNTEGLCAECIRHWHEVA